ncbi:SIR2 family protein [Porphyromonas gingivalis]|uniref:SIR2 family protein n=3 Tax=Porphyromonas gingivalis TaxID=837 RepID=UPI0015C9D86B|nr:SIR2 family protein [Porphyromonas gingivalis]
MPNIISPSLWQDEQGNYSQEYNELVDALREGHVVIWIGAGYSAGLGFPCWTKLIEQLAEIHFQSNLEELQTFKENLSKGKQSLIDSIELLKDSKEQLLNKLPQIFQLRKDDLQDPCYTPFKQIWLLSKKVITTNYDLAMDKTVGWADCHIILPHLTTKYQVLIGEERHRSFLWHLHGSVEDPNGCVVFEDQYRQVYNAQQVESETCAAFFLKHLATNYRFFFIGYGGFDGDIHIDCILKYVDGFRDKIESDKKHFILQHIENNLEREYLIPIHVNDFNQVPCLITDLVKKVAKHRACSENICASDRPCFGREGLMPELVQFMEENDPGLRWLYGEGGIGKTHLISQALQKVGRPYLYYDIGYHGTTSLRTLADKMGLGYIQEDDREGVIHRDFVDRAKYIDEILVFDNFHELVHSESVRETLLELRRHNQVIIISREQPPRNLVASSIRIDYLDKNAFDLLVDDYIQSMGYKPLLQNDRDRIWRITQGYPIAVILFLDILAKPHIYDSFDVENYLTNSHLSAVQQLKNLILWSYSRCPSQATKDLLLDLSLATKEVPRILLCKLMDGDLGVFEKEQETTALIRYTKSGDNFFYSLHPMVSDTLRVEAGERPHTHDIYMAYYLDEFGKERDIEALELAGYHALCGSEDGRKNYETKLQLFFANSDVKKLFSNDIKSSIRFLETFCKFERGSNNPAVFHQLAVLYCIIGDSDQARDVLKKGLDKFKGNNYLLLQEAIIERREHNMQEAERTLLRLKAEDNILARNELGILYRSWGDLVNRDERIGYYSRAESVLLPLSQEGNVAAKNELGILYRSWGDLVNRDERIGYYGRAESVLLPLSQEGNVAAKNELGILYRSWGDLVNRDERIGYYGRAESVLLPLSQEGNVAAKNELGILYRSWANELEGEERNAKFEQAVEQLKPLADNKNYRAINELAQTYRAWGGYKNVVYLESAVDYYRSAIEINQYNIQSYDGLCRTLDTLGKFDDCIDFALKGLTIKPKDSRLIEILVSVYWYGKKDSEKALEYLDQLPENRKEKWQNRISKRKP